VNPENGYQIGGLKMLKVIKTQTSTGKVLSEKDATENWWGTYHDNCVFGWCGKPKYYDATGNQVGYQEYLNGVAKKMVCVNHGKDVTITLIRL
jgi:hypothetical protein